MSFVVFLSFARFSLWYDSQDEVVECGVLPGVCVASNERPLQANETASLDFRFVSTLAVAFGAPTSESPATNISNVHVSPGLTRNGSPGSIFGRLLKRPPSLRYFHGRYPPEPRSAAKRTVSLPFVRSGSMPATWWRNFPSMLNTYTPSQPDAIASANRAA